MVAKYRKTKRGEWVIYGTVHEVCVGDVLVSKRDGSSKTVQVTRLGKPFQSGKLTMVYGYLKTGQRRKKYPSVMGGRCKECGGEIVDAPHHRAMMGYCGDCAFDEFDM